MKKLTVLLCAAAMAVALCTSSFAAPSRPGPVDPVPGPYRPGNGGNGGNGGGSNANSNASNNNNNAGGSTNNNAAPTTPAGSITLTVNSDKTDAAVLADADGAIATPATTADVAEFDETQHPNAFKFIKMMTEDVQHTTAEILSALNVSGVVTTEGGKAIDTSKLSIISKVYKFQNKSGKKLPPGKISASFTGNELTKDKTDDQLVIVQVDPETDKVYFVDVKIDPATNTLSADFPCTGPFVICEIKA